MNHFSELQSQHENLLQQENTGNDILENVQTYIKDVRFKSSNVSSSQEREQLRANTRYWASYVYAQTGEFPNTELTPFSGEISEETAVSSSSLPKYIIIGIAVITILSLFTFMISSFFSGGAEADGGELAFLQTKNAQVAVTNAAVTQTVTAMETQAPQTTATPIAVIIASPTFAITATPAPTADLSNITSDNAVQMKPIMTLGGNSGAILDVAFSSDGQQLAASGADGTIRLWNMNDINAPSWTLELDQTGWTQAVTYSTNGTQLATGGNDRLVRIVDMEGYPFAQFSGHKGFIFGLDYTPDSLQLASGDGDGVLILWNVGSGGLISTTTVGKDAIRELDFSPKQEFLAIANATDGFKLLDYPSLRQRCAFSDASALTTAVSDDSTFVVFGTADGLLIRIDPNSRSCAIIDRVQAHKGAVNSVALNENSNMMVSGGEDGVVFITPDGISLTGHTGSVESVAINPAGTLIASASADGTIILWGIPSE